MGRRIAQQPLDLLPVSQQTVHNLFILRLFAQTWLISQSFFNADGLHPFHRNHFGKAVDLTIGHLQNPADISNSRF